MSDSRLYRATPASWPTVSTWCARALRTGAGLGAALAATAAVCLFIATRNAASGRPRIGQAVGAALVTLALPTLILPMVAAATGWMLRWRAGRAIAVGLQAAVGALLACVVLASAALRVLSGSFLTIGALEFVTESGDHLFKTIATNYGGSLVMLATASVAIGAALAWSARRALAPGPRLDPERQTSFVLGLVLPLGVASASLLPIRLMNDLARASPEVAFVASLDAEAIEEEPAERLRVLTPRQLVIKRPSVVPGQLQSEGDVWREAVKKLPSRKTNVIMLTLESISVRHLAYAGYDRETTPNLDRIASRSMRMRRAWTTATHSNYAQTAILSSLFPRRNTGLDVYKRLDYPRVLLHDVFHLLGYSTATISSQDETWQGMLKFQQTGTPTFYRHSKNYEGARLDIGSELVVLDHVTVDVASDWIRRQGDRPWALYLNLQATHFPYKLQPGIPTPYQPTAVTKGRYTYLSYPEEDRQPVVNRYDNALSYVDEQIGKLEKFLERQNKLEDTLWIITADHGESFHDHGEVTHGKTLYDSESRIPLLVHWPAHVKPADVDEPVSHLDILPTVLDLMGVPPHPSFQGRSFADPTAHANQPNGIFMNIQGLRSAEAVLCWPWKLIVDRTARDVLLYNLERDPEEKENLVEREPVIAETLRITLAAQINAQLQYHRKGNPELNERYAPRLLTCPALSTPPAAR